LVLPKVDRLLQRTPRAEEVEQLLHLESPGKDRLLPRIQVREVVEQAIQNSRPPQELHEKDRRSPRIQMQEVEVASLVALGVLPADHHR